MDVKLPHAGGDGPPQGGQPAQVMGVCCPARRARRVGYIIPSRFALDVSARNVVQVLLTGAGRAGSTAAVAGIPRVGPDPYS